MCNRREGSRGKEEGREVWRDASVEKDCKIQGKQGKLLKSSAKCSWVSKGERLREKKSYRKK